MVFKNDVQTRSSENCKKPIRVCLFNSSLELWDYGVGFIKLVYHKVFVYENNTLD